MLLVERIVVVVAEVGAQELQVLGADEDGAARLCQPCDGGIAVELTGILQHLVVAVEAADAHASQSVDVLDLDVEVARYETGEVEARHLEEELVLVDGVGLIGKHEDEVDIALDLELTGSDGVAVAHDDGAPRPHVAHVEASAMEAPSGLHAVDDHACHAAHLALGELFHHLFHIFQAAVAVAGVELAQSADEDELVAVVTH